MASKVIRISYIIYLRRYESVISISIKQAANTLRVSFGCYTTDSYIENLIKLLEKILQF